MSILRVRDADGNVQEILAIKGEPGQSATIEIGKVTSVPSDASATVKNSGTPNAAILDFEIPRGSDGNTPVKGEDYFTEEEITQIKSDIQNTITPVVTVLISEDEDGNIVSSHSPQEILDLYSSGKGVIGITSISHYDDTIYQCVNCDLSIATFVSIHLFDDDSTVCFLEKDDNRYPTGFLTISKFTINSNKSVELEGDFGYSENSFPTYSSMKKVYEALLSRICDLEDTINNLISHGTEDPDSTITSTYYVKYDDNNSEV